MFPHERSLVENLAGKPFAIVGVNSDKDLVELKQKSTEAGITWRSFWNGKDGTRGPISKAWNVKGWPTLYLIDHLGVIRHKWVGSPGNEKLDEAIDALVAEATSSAEM